MAIAIFSFVAFSALIFKAVNAKSLGQQSRLPWTLLLADLLALSAGTALFTLARSTIEKNKIEDEAVKTARSVLACRPEEELDTSTVLRRLSLEIAEQKRREVAIVEKAADVICVIDTEGRFISASKAAYRDWGYKPEELKGKSIMDLIETDKAQDKSSLILTAIIGAQESIDKIVFECRLKKKSGEMLDVSWTAHWSASDRGLFCVVHDISERKQLEALKQEFMAMLSHDIRTPLTSMQWLLDLLESGSLGQLNEEGKTVSKRVKSECNRVIGLINDLLDLSKFETGKFVLQRNYIYISKVAGKACEALRPIAIAEGIDLVMAENEMTCYADEERIIQVFMNLLSNAIKFSPRGSKIETTFEESKDAVLVSVCDQGRGIPEEKLGSIFNKFEQVKAADGARGKGSGLGLSICKAIIEEHGGKIGAERRKEGGSRFWFTLPKSNPDEDPELDELP